MIVPDGHRQRHLATQYHHRAVQGMRYKAAQAYGEAPKHGVELLPAAINFGHVEFSTLLSVNTMLETTVTVRVGTTACYLLDATLHSAVSRRR
jgi:hypothetical protein